VPAPVEMEAAAVFDSLRARAKLRSGPVMDNVSDDENKSLKRVVGIFVARAADSRKSTIPGMRPSGERTICGEASWLERIRDFGVGASFEVLEHGTNHLKGRGLRLGAPAAWASMIGSGPSAGGRAKARYSYSF